MKFYVKQGEREKGPFSIEQLRESLAGIALQGSTLVRAEDSEEWVRLDSVVRPKRAALQIDPAAEAEDREAEKRARREKANRDVLIGGLICLIGIAVTAVSYSSAAGSGGRYVLAWGAIVFGAIRLVGGLAAR